VNERRSRPVWNDVDDQALLGHLRRALRRHAEPPAAVVDLAKASFGLRRLDAELAALVADSFDTVAGPRVRSLRASRLVSFESAELAVELEASPDGPGWRIIGQLDPPGHARIELWQPNGPTGHAVDADPLGRFALDVPGPGPISLRCHRAGLSDVATAWVLLA
jgi:hypothetical protein